MLQGRECGQKGRHFSAVMHHQWGGRWMGARKERGQLVEIRIPQQLAQHRKAGPQRIGQSNGHIVAVNGKAPLRGFASAIGQTVWDRMGWVQQGGAKLGLTGIHDRSADQMRGQRVCSTLCLVTQFWPLRDVVIPLDQKRNRPGPFQSVVQKAPHRIGHGAPMAVDQQQRARVVDIFVMATHMDFANGVCGIGIQIARRGIAEVRG
mmetsp:Transcript_22849/g.38120  ORF Transcript_22849/g.38120 Transcript_22849/m.38120 type:complete len:206 (+) Transcript_22849:186-803(+)